MRISTSYVGQYAQSVAPVSMDKLNTQARTTTTTTQMRDFSKAYEETKNDTFLMSCGEAANIMYALHGSTTDKEADTIKIYKSLTHNMSAWTAGNIWQRWYEITQDRRYNPNKSTQN